MGDQEAAAGTGHGQGGDIPQDLDQRIPGIGLEANQEIGRGADPMPNPGVDLGADRGTDHGLLLNQEADHQTDLRPGQEVVQEVNRGRLIRINQEIKEPIPEKNQGLHPGTLGVDLSRDLAADPGQTKVEAEVKNLGESL